MLIANRIFHPNTGSADRIIPYSKIRLYIYFDFARLPLPVKSIIFCYTAIFALFYLNFQ